MDIVRKSYGAKVILASVSSSSSSEDITKPKGESSSSSEGLGTEDNYNIETGSSDTEENLGRVLSKRPLSPALSTALKKKPKLFEGSKKNATLNKLDLSDSISPLNSSYDAFATFLNKAADDTEFKCPPTPTKHEDDDDDLFSQSFNTQIINQIDVAITHEESTSLTDSETLTNDSYKSDKVKRVDDFKMPILKSFTAKIASLKVKKDKSALFVDKDVTALYKKEVDDLFEKIQRSIRELGTEKHENTLNDKMLEVFFAEDFNTQPQDLNDRTIQEQLNKTKEEIEDLSFFAKANCSFGSFIRQALMSNASKSVCVSQAETVNADFTLNRTLPVDPGFEKLGDFYDMPLRVKELIKQHKGIESLYDWQRECLNMAMTNRPNLIYALPTSGGKTLVAEILMLRELLCYKRNALFVLPYVSIVQEKVWDFSPFGVALDFLVEEYASSKGSYPPKKRRRKRSVYIATIEKALGLINSLIELGRLNEIGLIVIDELHLIGEEGRGATLEALLTKIMFLNGRIQLVGMSATIGNIKDLARFLNADVYTKNFRPVELVEYVKCEKEIARVNWGCASEEDLLTDVKRLDYKYSEAVSKVDPDMLGGLVLQVIPKGSCLVFCPSKNNCENVVHLLCKLTKPHLREYKKGEKDALMVALGAETGELCHTLKVSVPFGIAYHHSGLTGEERRLLEDAFRAGVISVICCTSTLAAGVNLPAKRVILRSPYIGKEFISLARYKQMAGRAGRAGYGEIGESIIVTSKSDLPKVKRLLMGPMNRAFSSLHQCEGAGLRHLLLSCIGLGIANTRSDLQKVTRASLMSVQTDQLEVDIKKLTDVAIKKLFKLGALQESSEKGRQNSQRDVSVRLRSSSGSELDASLDTICSNTTQKKKRVLMLTNASKLVVSSLGTAAIKGGLDLLRAHELYDDLYQAQKSLVLLNCLHLLYLVTPYETAEQIKPNIHVYYDVLTHLNEKELQTARVLGFDEGVVVKMATGKVSKQISEKVLNRFYVTLMLYDLWNETPVFKVSEKYQINRGIVQNLMTSSATFASNVVNFCEQLDEFWAFGHLLKGMSQRLSHCCIKELAPLMELPAVKQSRAKQLYAAGYKQIQSIAKANVNELVEKVEYMSRRTAGQLIAAAKMILLEKVENLREEAEDVLEGADMSRTRQSS
ncbi:helicase POLQ-like isoform X1 [Anthonomus grandis grandis]|uniref:helicase POLQ-like isoform X1 n=1 Tax=Anthonomus grandis grandis TaxID=2921223 RepID=UPI00216608D5|nr:helicase POLQ-like isoform X1 [Anthonomus grandis grandis]